MKETEIKHGNCIMIPSRNGNSIIVHYEGSDLCISCTDYDKSNVFYVVKSNPMYMPMKLLFREIKKNDKLCYLNSNKFGTKFEWISDERRNLIKNRLVIIETIDGFRVQFINNSKDMSNCTVRFSLVNSNDENIVKAFDNIVSGMMNKWTVYSNTTIKK